MAEGCFDCAREGWQNSITNARTTRSNYSGMGSVSCVTARHWREVDEKAARGVVSPKGHGPILQVAVRERAG